MPMLNMAEALARFRRGLSGVTRRGRLLVTCSALALVPSAAHGQGQREIPKDFPASLVCRAERTFVLCLIPVAPPPGYRLNFAEANLLKEPPFVKSVTTRSTYKPETQRKPNLRLAFVAKQAGTGEIAVQARALLCSEASGWCDHLAKVLTATVTVPP